MPSIVRLVPSLRTGFSCLSLSQTLSKTSVLGFLFFSITNSHAVENFPVVAEQISDSGRINWTDMRVESTSFAQTGYMSNVGYSEQEVRAMTSANQELQELIYSVQVDQQNSYKNLLQRNDEIGNYIASTVKKYDVSETVYNTDQSVEITTFLDLHTLFRPYVLEMSLVLEKVPKPKTHTGIIIDARNVSYKPMVLPCVSTTKIPNWLSVSHFSQYTASTTLPFVYATDAAHPRVANRVGRNPLIIQATSTMDGCLVVPHEATTDISEFDYTGITGNGFMVIVL